MGGTTINTSATKIEAFKVQSSSQGVTIAWLRGVNRVPGNLLWYNGFKAIARRETSGGKGGTEVVSTDYTYVADAIMAVAAGPILDIPRVWVGKALYDGGVAPIVFKTATEDFAVPGSGVMTYTLVKAATYRSTIAVVSAGGGEGYWYEPLAPGADYVVSAAGVLTVLNESFRGFSVRIQYQYAQGSETRTALQELGLTFGRGSIGQALWSGLLTYPAAEQINYSGLAYVAGQAYQLTDQASLENHTFEVVGPMAYHLGSAIPDVDVSAAVRELMLDTTAGAGFPSANSASWEQWSNYCVAAGVLGSPLLTEQAQMAEVLREVADATITAPVWSDGLLKMIPYGDAEETNLGRTYVPNLEPLYDLDNDAYLVDGDQPPLRYRHKSPAQRYNHIRVEYRDRNNDYNIAVAAAYDLADIEERGKRSRDIIKLSWVCDGAVAYKIAQLILQRSLSVRTEYECDLPIHFALIECAEILTHTDVLLQFDRLPVRVIAIEEVDDETLRVVTEDYPIGAASAAEYDHEYPDGFIPDYNVKPGSVIAPAFFEAPVTWSTTGLEVLVAVAGLDPNWGGANVWVSVDGSGTNYRLLGTVREGARYGTMRSAAGTTDTTLAVELTTDATLGSGGAEDARALQTLIYMGGTTPEYAAFETATLVAANQYDLAGTLVRGAYGTGAKTHALGAAFVRVDDTVISSGALDFDMIGRELWFKFTSFNVYGGAEESLADAEEYRYTVTGYMAKLPPSTPTGAGYTIEAFGVRLLCAKNPEPDVIGYEWRAGATLAASELLESAGGTSYPWRVQLAGTFTAWVAAVDRFGNKSQHAQIDGTVLGAQVTALSATFIGPDLSLDYDLLAGAFAIGRVEVRYGNDFASATVATGASLNNFRYRADWVGARRWWVVAYDVAGNIGVERSLDVAVTAPGEVRNQRAEVVDNNVLIYFDAPNTGTLPVARYDVRKGSTYPGSTRIGSNADSTFTVVFEQLGGTYTYWLIAYDSAGNPGAPASLTATVSQPPDYTLQARWASTFDGAKTNMLLDDGALVGPINTTETWAQHFSSRGWVAPLDQTTAGFPLYIEPSEASGAYEEEFDYGAVLPSTTVTATVNYDILDGAVGLAVQVYHKLTAGGSWIAATAAAGSQVLISNFRYIKVVVELTATAGANLLRLNALEVTLSTKRRNDGGTGEVTNATAGVLVPFNYPFIDADTPTVQANGTVPLVPVVDFSDVPNPTEFRVYLYTLAGVKTTGTFSWSVGGY